jgi:hypothetical protein
MNALRFMGDTFSLFSDIQKRIHDDQNSEAMVSAFDFKLLQKSVGFGS